jgi:hypothetical protein
MVRDIFMEVGVAAAYFFNRYLETGDSTHIDIRKMPYNWRIYGNFWKNLHAYNQTLPAGQRLKIHGIDFERGEVFKLLHRLRPSQAAPAGLIEFFDKIESLDGNDSLIFTDDKFSFEILILRKAFAEYHDLLKVYYGAQFAVIQSAVENATPATQTVKPRNEAWVKSFRDIIRKNSIEKLIGFFGKGHTIFSHETSPANELKKGRYFKGEVVSIRAIYSNYEYLGRPGEISTYMTPKEKKWFEAFYDPRCRATIVSGDAISKEFVRAYADYAVFAVHVNK